MERTGTTICRKTDHCSACLVSAWHRTTKFLPAMVFAITYLAMLPAAHSADHQMMSTSSDARVTANGEKAILLSMQLLDNWKPKAWYKTSQQESVSERSIEQVQYQEEIQTATNSATTKSTTELLTPFEAKPIESLGIDIGRNPGLTPRNRAIEDGLYDKHPSTIAVRTWPLTTRTWTAPKTRHRPLYFEEVNAERYGYTCSRIFQPALSSVHFFGTIPYLPYLMAADPPCQCNYTLGHYRPGSCPPYRKHCWPFSVKGVGVEAAVAVGMIALIP